MTRPLPIACQFVLGLVAFALTAGALALGTAALA